MMIRHLRHVTVVITLLALMTMPVVAAQATDSSSPTRMVTSGAAAARSSSDAVDRPPAGFVSRFADVDGLSVHYVRGGHGSPVVLIHGWPQTWAEWRAQMPRLARDHTVIAVDLRGTGASGIPARGYDSATMAGDIHGLMQLLGLADGVALVGHDIGLWVAYAYAAQWPHEVSQLAVMEAPIPDQSIYDFPALSPDGKPSEWHFGLFQEPFAETLVAGHEGALVRGFIGQFLINRSAFSAQEYAYYAGLLRDRRHVHAWFDMYRELRHDVREDATLLARGKLTMPVLAIGGQGALGAKVGQQWRTYATRVDARVLPGSGHWVTEERPALLTKMLSDFLH